MCWCLVRLIDVNEAAQFGGLMLQIMDFEFQFVGKSLKIFEKKKFDFFSLFCDLLIYISRPIHIALLILNEFISYLIA